MLDRTRRSSIIRHRRILNLSLFLAIAFTLGGAARPPWADGRLIWEKGTRGARPQNLVNFDQRMLALHNRERAKFRAAPMTWDIALARAAASYGPALARLSRLAHSPYSSRTGQGENLFMGTRGAYQPEDMIASWTEEKSLFRPGVFPNVSRSNVGRDVAHYTQMIWPTTIRVGCALHRSRKWDYLICRYSPPGNVVGRQVP